MPSRMTLQLSRRWCSFLTNGLVWLTLSRCLATSLPAAEIFVDNRHGSDAYDGSSETPVSDEAGPVRTLLRATRLAKFGDTIVLANNGVAYQESIQLVGTRHSGSPLLPFVLRGNGAVISGAMQVPPSAWRKLETNLWQLKPWRKGHYQLCLDGKPVTEHAGEARTSRLPDIPENQWCAWRGSIYLRTANSQRPGDRNYSIAVRSVGLTLYRVRNVLIQNVTFRHFRLDGVNAHDGCQEVVLENVTASENGRAGLAVGGSSSLTLRNSALKDNRKDSLLITELGLAEVIECNLSQPPTVVGETEAKP